MAIIPESGWMGSKVIYRMLSAIQIFWKVEKMKFELIFLIQFLNRIE